MNSTALKFPGGSVPTSHVPDACLYRIIESHAERTPDAPAVMALGRAPLSYAGLCRVLRHTIETLNSIGIGRNDRVALTLSDGPEAAVVLLALAAGATCTPLNARYRAGEFDFFLRSLSAKALIVESGLNSPALDVAKDLGITVIELTPLLDSEAGSFTLVATESARSLFGGPGEGNDVALVLHTSGTTSRSKLVPLTHTNLCASAQKVQAAYQLTKADRYLNVTPLFYSQGIMLTISSIYAGAGVVCTQSFNAAHFFKFVEEFEPTWYSAAPAVHQAILAHARHTRKITARRRLRFIRSAAAPLPEQVRAGLERFFRSPVLESYGMTECYPISSNPLPPGKRKAGAAGLAAGTQIAIIDDAGKSLAAGQRGEIAVSGPQVMGGYLNDRGADGASFAGQWFRTGDEGYFDNEGYLFITGRIKEMINRGGEKISPQEVDHVLLEHGAISEAAVFPVPHRTLGEDIAALVVPREGATVTERELQEFAATRLAQFKVPRHVFVVKAIPKTPTGKVQRIGLAEKFSSQRLPQKVSEQLAICRSQAGMEEKLRKILAQALGVAVSMVGLQDNFFELGGNSLLGMQLLAQIEQVFGRHLPLGALSRAATVEQLANVLQEETWIDSWRSLVPIRTAGTKPPFFWVHGDASSGILADYLGPDQPVYGLDHQGHDGRPALYTTVESIASYYIQEIRGVQVNGPYFIGGFSFGGTVAFEMAQQLKRKGEEVALLFILDSHFPGTSLSDSGDGLKEAPFSRAALRRHRVNLYLLGHRQKLTYITRRATGILKDAIQSRMSRAVKALRRARWLICFALGRALPFELRSGYILHVYQQARTRYSPKPYPGRAIYIKSKVRSKDHQLAWSRAVSGGFDVYEVPGDHLDIIQGPYLNFWAGKLKSALQAAQKQNSEKAQ